MEKKVIVFTHYVQMDTYEIPETVAKKGKEAIERYIFENKLEPVKSDSRDWEIVNIQFEKEKNIMATESFKMGELELMTEKLQLKEKSQ